MASLNAAADPGETKGGAPAEPEHDATMLEATAQSLFASPDFAVVKCGQRQATPRPWADWATLPPGPAICSSAVFGSCEDETGGMPEFFLTELLAAL